MGPPSYMRPVVDRNVVMRCILVLHCKIVYICVFTTWSTPYCLYEKLKHPWNMCVCVCVCTYKLSPHRDMQFVHGAHTNSKD